MLICYCPFKKIGMIAHTGWQGTKDWGNGATSIALRWITLSFPG